MSVAPPARPQKGKKIPHDWFGNLYDYVRSLELRGDFVTTQVKRDRSGTVVRAPRDAQSLQATRSQVYVCKISYDNSDGTYNGEEQESDEGTFSDNTDEGLEFGSDTDDVGYLYEINGLIGIPLNTYVFVHKVPDISGEPIWYFDGSIFAYGVKYQGAWVEITAGSSGAYSWKQKDSDGTTDTSPSVTGALNAYDVNETEAIPNGTIVWLRYDGTDYRFEYTRQNFWAKITGETSGSYSWTELEGDATTTTTRTGTTNAVEVNAREGIPTNSIVYMVPHQTDDTKYRFEFHGANVGTLDEIDAGTSSTANTDTWNRDNQGATRGEEHQFVARLTLDSATGELINFTRDQEHDANGHEEALSAETKTILGVLTPSEETYEFVDCATGLSTIARFTFDDLPTDDYCWVYNGTCYVKAYNDGISSGTATSPVPCVYYAPTTPASCSALDVSDFDEDFNDTLETPCKWDGDGNGVYTGGYLEFNDTTNGEAVTMVPPCMDDEFTVVLDFDAAWPTADTGVATRACYFSMTIGGTRYDMVSARYENSTSTGGVYIDTPGSVLYTDTTPFLSGTFTITRNSSDLVTFKKDSTTLHTLTKGGGVSSLFCGNLTVEPTYTGIYLRLKDLSFTEP